MPKSILDKYFDLTHEEYAKLSDLGLLSVSSFESPISNLGFKMLVEEQKAEIGELPVEIIACIDEFPKFDGNIDENKIRFIAYDNKFHAFLMIQIGKKYFV